MNIELWKLLAMIAALAVAVATVPCIWVIRSESRKIRAEMRTVE